MKQFGMSPVCCGLGSSPGGLFLAPADSFGKRLPLPKPQPGAIPNSCLEHAENGLGMALPWLSWRGDGSGAGWVSLDPELGQVPLTVYMWGTPKKPPGASGEVVELLSLGFFHESLVNSQEWM